MRKSATRGSGFVCFVAPPADETRRGRRSDNWRPLRPWRQLKSLPARFITIVFGIVLAPPLCQGVRAAAILYVSGNTYVNDHNTAEVLHENLPKRGSQAGSGG